MAENPSQSPPNGEDEDPIEIEFELEDIEIEGDSAPSEPEKVPEPAKSASEPDSPRVEGPSEIDFSEDETEIVFDDEDDGAPASPPPRRRQQPAPESAPAEEPAPSPEAIEEAVDEEMEEMEEALDAPDSSSSEADEAPAEAPAPPPAGTTRKKIADFVTNRLPKKPLELASFGILAIFLLLGAYSLAKGLNDAVAESDEVLPSRSVPGSVKGEHLTFKIEEIYWRDRVKGDPGDPLYKILPEFKVRLESSGGTAYLQALFKDEYGKIRGDSVTYKIQNGKFIKTGTADALYLGSGGFTNRVYFAEYVEFAKPDRWTITLKESVDNESWSEISYFEIPAKTKSK